MFHLRDNQIRSVMVNSMRELELMKVFAKLLACVALVGVLGTACTPPEGADSDEPDAEEVTPEAGEEGEAEEGDE